jgi:hypothetical protein
MQMLKHNFSESAVQRQTLATIRLQHRVLNLRNSKEANQKVARHSFSRIKKYRIIFGTDGKPNWVKDVSLLTTLKILLGCFYGG